MVMTDRDLLELAARAAGIGPLDFEYPKREGHGMYFGPRLPMPQRVLMAAMHTYWNPLADNGDALRLAVKLELIIGCYAGSIIVDGKGVAAEEHDLSDRDAATRRAIVRAAAELGKQSGEAG